MAKIFSCLHHDSDSLEGQAMAMRMNCPNMTQVYLTEHKTPTLTFYLGFYLNVFDQDLRMQ